MGNKLDTSPLFDRVMILLLWAFLGGFLALTLVHRGFVGSYHGLNHGVYVAVGDCAYGYEYVGQRGFFKACD